MKSGDVVFVKPTKQKGLLMGFGVDMYTNEEKCSVYLDENKLIFVKKEDICFIEHLDESLKRTLNKDNKNEVVFLAKKERK